MLVMFTHGGTAETVEIMCHIANLQLIVAGAILFWLLEGAGAKISKVLVLVYVFDAMVSIFLAFIFGRALLFHYCTHEGRSQSQYSVADMRVHCSILVSTCPWKICPYNANPQRPFFLQTYIFLLRAVRTAPAGTGKCVQSTEISVQFDTTL